MEQILTLSALLKALEKEGLLAQISDEPKEVSFSNVTYDSRKVTTGALFICKGNNFKEEYLFSAIKQKAACYVAEREYNVNIPGIIVNNVRKALAVIAREFYNHPGEKLKLIGITGTKGKTTTAYFIKSMLDAADKTPAGILSTIETYTGGKSAEAHLTTPESLELEGYFDDALKHGLKHLVMEVSSHAYKAERVYGLTFNIGLFLNLAKDHIGPQEHPDFEDYFACKLRLMCNSETAIIYRGTDRFKEIYATAKRYAKKVITYGEDESCDFYVTETKKEKPGFSFLLGTKEKKIPCRITMEGRFNILNALAAAAVGKTLGLSDEAIIGGMREVRVKGRMNLFEKEGRKVIVDYAHNLLSFNELFKSLRKDYPTHKIKVLCGCPGDKNKGRRSDIGTLCGQYADFVYLTEEDPGYEDPLTICNEMARYIHAYHDNYLIIPERTAAIEKAIGELKRDEILILAGKGEEDYQKREGRYDYYASDLAIAKRCLEAAD